MVQNNLLGIQRVNFDFQVHEEWLHGLRQKSVRDVFGTHGLTKADASLHLAPSHPTLPRHWSRVCIKVVKKEEGLVPK